MPWLFREHVLFVEQYCKHVCYTRAWEGTEIIVQESFIGQPRILNSKLGALGVLIADV